MPSDSAYAELAERMSPVCAAAVDSFEVAAVLEADGITDVDGPGTVLGTATSSTSPPSFSGSTRGAAAEPAGRRSVAGHAR